MRKAKKKAAPKKKAVKKAAPKKAVVRKVRKGAKAWTAADIAMVRKLYRTTPTKTLARQMKRSVASLQAKARTLGLKKAVVKKVAKKKVAKKKAAPKRKAVARKKAAPKRKAVAKKKAAPKRKVAKKTARRKK